ncbi:MAG: hypothetical protein AABX32_01580 [Nanoarchaeota archaeon]
MNSRNGSAMGMAIIIGFVLLAAGIVLFFFPFTLEAGQFIEQGGDSASCSLSLIGGTGAINCPISNVAVLKDEVKLNDKKFIDRNSKSTDDMAKEAISRLLVNCLNTGGGYNSRAFSSENYIFRESVCIECSKINIDSSAGEISGLTQYVRDTTSNVRSDKKFLEVLTRDPEHLKGYMLYGDGLGLAPAKTTFVFRPGQEYTVFFIGMKKGYITSSVKTAADLVTSGGASILEALFLTQDSYYAYVTESQNIPNVCDRLVN